MFRLAIALLCLLPLLTACNDGAQDGPLRVSVPVTAARANGLGNDDSGSAERILLGAIAQTLVVRDGEGEIAPGLAQRWTVLDDGSYIFRLGDHEWSDGTKLSASQVARRLREARRGTGMLAPLMARMSEVDAVTPEILELRLDAPDPGLLALLTAPSLSIHADGEGLGPFAIVQGYAIDDARLLLEPHRPPLRDDGGDVEPLPPPGPADTIELRFERPGLAAARFKAGEAQIVLGGDWTTLAYALAIDPAARLVVEPVIGLFGLAFVEQQGFLAESENRQLLSMAIDRDAMAAAFGRAEAEARTAIVPVEAQGGGPIAGPPWAAAEMAARRRFARDAVSRWTAAHGEVEPLRVALPDAAGSRLIFAYVRASWAAIGIRAERVGIGEDADLRLLDRVAPTDSIDWFLSYFRCERGYPCSEAYLDAMTRIGEAETDRVRAIRLAEAARALDGAAPFIPLLRPIRWALVAPGIGGFTPNPFASHPLDEIVAGTN